MLTGKSGRPPLTVGTGWISEIFPRKGVLTFNNNGQDERVLFLASKVYIFEKRLGTKQSLDQVSCWPAQCSSCFCSSPCTLHPRYQAQNYPDSDTLLGAPPAPLSCKPDPSQIPSGPNWRWPCTIRGGAPRGGGQHVLLLLVRLPRLEGQEAAFWGPQHGRLQHPRRIR